MIIGTYCIVFIQVAVIEFYLSSCKSSNQDVM